MFDVVIDPPQVIVDHGIYPILVSSAAAIPKTGDSLDRVTFVLSPLSRGADQASPTVTRTSVCLPRRPSGTKHVGGYQVSLVGPGASVPIHHRNLKEEAT